MTEFQATFPVLISIAFSFQIGAKISILVLHLEVSLYDAHEAAYERKIWERPK